MSVVGITVPLRAIFAKGLLDKLKDEPATREEPASLDDLISLCIVIDNWMRERERGLLE